MPDNNAPFSWLKSIFNKSAPSSGPVYTGDAPLIRQKYLWGMDVSGNPCFLVLIGEHHTQKLQDKPTLEGAVVYTDSVIFRGKGGHFPAFEAVRIVNTMDYSTRKQTRGAYYKRDVGRYGYPINRKRILPDFVALNPGVSIPYYDNISHRDCVKLVKAHNLKWTNFTLAEDPSDVLKLDDFLSPYYEDLVMLLANPNLYMRKKVLKTLMAKNPPVQIWRYLLDKGSSELISGAFLEFALSKNDLLLPEAEAIKDASLHWTEDSYAQGIRRTAALYYNSFDEKAKALRKDLLRATLPQLRFQPVHVGGKDIPSDKVLNGMELRKYSLQGLLFEYYYQYSREERRTIRHRREKLYANGYYSDSVTLNRVQLKNTIQESQIYGAADIIGKTAYYLDAPGLVYYFLGNGKSKALRYFWRYLTRVINVYAETDEDKFMETMTHLFTSYTSADYCCKFSDNFQFNYFIKYYLYHSFDKKPSTSWQARYSFMQNDQLKAAEGRYEYMPEIWNRHLNRVIEIAIRAKIETVLKGMYFILKDPVNEQSMERGASYQDLSGFAASAYSPLAQMGVSMIQKKLEAEEGFRAEIMAVLMQSENQAVQELAREYFKRAGGIFQPDDLAGMLLIPDLEKWEPLIRGNLLNLDSIGYIQFLQAALNITDKLTDIVTSREDILTEILNSTLHMLNHASREEKVKFLQYLTAWAKSGDCSERTLDLIGGIIFTLPVSELKELLNMPQMKAVFAKSESGVLFTLLQAVRSGGPPDDAGIAELLERGNSKMLRTLAELLEGARVQLPQRFSTLLLLLECDVAAFNELARSVFESLLPEEQEKLHFIILDSPVAKVYAFGIDKLYEIYESKNRHIPKAFIIKMMEHTSPEVRGFIAGKIQDVMETLGGGDQELFLYYAKTLLLLPNRLSRSKDYIYEALPQFVMKYVDKQPEIEELLLEIGGSNIIRDSERALVALANLRKEAV